MLQKAARLLIISAFFILALSVVSTVLADEPCPNNVCDTAIGSFDVSNPMSVMMRIFSVVLSLGAAGATIVIIIAGYKLVTSRGDKEKIQGARETITSAIVGLLFIVFSLVILSIVAGNILKIPGFS